MTYFLSHFEIKMNKIILIGIAGGTGSGKTSVSKAISAEFSTSEVALIQQDSYYKDVWTKVAAEQFGALFQGVGKNKDGTQ